MYLNEYQFRAMEFRLGSANDDYALFNIAAEVGELLSIQAKWIRDGGKPEEVREKTLKELGDVLWHIAAIAKDNGFQLEDVAKANIEKLSSRKARGVITGSGDDR